uniref:Uncharacterized protein n=1 Tax=Oryza rufipogon TaxID=4529 RepID=A0A0E0QR58_ORYRU
MIPKNRGWRIREGARGRTTPVTAVLQLLPTPGGVHFDVYGFGIVVLKIASGRRHVSQPCQGRSASFLLAATWRSGDAKPMDPSSSRSTAVSATPGGETTGQTQTIDITVNSMSAWTGIRY